MQAQEHKGQVIFTHCDFVSYGKHLTLKYEKLNSHAKTPTQATEGSAGFDLYATKDVVIGPGETIVMDTGLKFEIPPGHLMYISSKSGLAARHNIFVLNSPALIDSDYRGEVSVILHKTSDPAVDDVSTIRRKGQPYFFEEGDKVAQFVILPYPKIQLLEEEINVNTERGEGGFGSTGR